MPTLRRLPRPQPLRKNSVEYYKNCNIRCVSVFGGKIYVCPRAGVLALKGIYTPEDGELIDLNIEKNPKILRKKLFDFYSRKSFTACNYCTFMEDKAEGAILPAIQIEQ